MSLSREMPKPETHHQLPDDYLSIANEFLPFTVDECLGTFYSVWDINSWSSLQIDHVVRGPLFKTNQHEWNVLLYPTGNNQVDSLSIFIENIECKSKTAANDICAQFILCIVDPTDPTKFIHQEAQHRFNKLEADWGFNQYMDLKILNMGDEQNTPLVVNDNVKIISIIRLIKDSTGVLWHNFIGYDSKQMSGYVGLYNQGATCYMNSLFQSLFFTNLYRKAIYQIPTENDDPNTSSILALQRLFYNLQFSNTGVSTTELTKSFGWNTIQSFMQHDVQEFNRLLQDNIERKMRGTPVEDSINQLFVGRMKSYIKCINVDYESSRSEDYYDIQLNVKGCKDLEASFHIYILEETLEGNNRYQAGEGYGLQDARKGVMFESFPPVLHLQLKRFEYDVMKNSMIKINDRHEFPTEIDLEPFLSDSADKSESHKYILHGVLVHTGDLTGGHYFAFVRPTKQNKWFKFDDDRVTPVTKHEVLEENFGGETEYAPVNFRNVKRFTNAYMLVYIRKSHRNKVLEDITQNDIPTHLVKQIQYEHELLENYNKQKVEQHLYMKAYIANPFSVMMNREREFISVTEGGGFQERWVLRSQLLREFIKEYTNENQLLQVQVRNIVNRKNGSLRPDKPFSDDYLNLSLEQVCKKVSSGYPFLRFYMEPCYIDKNRNPYFPPACLIFIKIFDPVQQSFCSLGHYYINPNNQVLSIVDDLKRLTKLERGTEIDIYEEVDNRFAELLDVNNTFLQHDIGEGDIICIQVKLSLNEIQNLREQVLCVNVIEYVNYLHNRITATFAPIKQIDQENTLQLRTDMFYQDMITILAKKLNSDPNCILITLPDANGMPQNQPYLYSYPWLKLSDILSCMPKQLKDSNCFKLYYDVLTISLSEYKSRKLIKLNICYPTLSDLECSKEFMMPELAKISDLVKEVNTHVVDGGDLIIRIFQVVEDKLYKVFEPNEIIPKGINLYAESVPKEEFNIGEQDSFILVYHYERELTQTHSVPFKFLVIKDEEFKATKKRLQSRVGLNDQNWKQVKINIITKGLKSNNLNDDNYKLGDYHFRPGQILGLDHIDPSGKYNTRDKGLYITI